MISKFTRLIVCFVLITSCSNVRLIIAEKSIVKAGVPFGTPFFSYTLELYTNSEVEFISIKINENTFVKSFSVINIDTRMQGDNSKLFNKGKYRLQFDLPIKEKITDDKNLITVICKSKKDLKYLTRKIKMGRVIQLR